MTLEPASPQGVTATLRELDALVSTHGPSIWTVTGTLTGWRVARSRWGRGDLCETGTGGDGIVGRFPIAIPPGLVTQLRHQAGGEDLPDGSELRVNGRVEIGDRWNPLRLVATAAIVVDPESDLVRARRLLVEQLQVSGALDHNRTLTLPAVVTRLGLVSAASGEAGRRDFLGRLSDHPTPIDIVEHRAAMSGPTAPKAISDAIDGLGLSAVDAIVVCRGGGAASDLSAFDTGPVATAIARSPVPVILGVGHSTDRTVADLTAHTRVATPTAAADLLIDRATAARTPFIRPAAVIANRYPESSMPTALAPTTTRKAGSRTAPAVCIGVALLVATLFLILVLHR